MNSSNMNTNQGVAMTVQAQTIASIESGAGSDTSASTVAAFAKVSEYKGMTVYNSIVGEPCVRLSDLQRAAAPASRELPALSNTEMFDLAAPYFAWNAESWHKATQGTIGMPNLLEYTRASILADRAAVDASQAAEASIDVESIQFRLAALLEALGSKDRERRLGNMDAAGIVRQAQKALAAAK
jgi:hypothetical protein